MTADRPKRGRPPRYTIALDIQVWTRATRAEARAWDAHAKSLGITRAEWLRRLANTAAGINPRAIEP